MSRNLKYKLIILFQISLKFCLKIKMEVSAFLLGIVIINLSGCGVFESNKGEVRLVKKWGPSKFQIFCGENATNQDCNGSVGLFINRKRFVFSEKASRCTAWLIEDDIIITNMHCLNEELDSQFKVPIQDYYFKYINQDSPENTKLINVVEFIKGRNEDETPSDYAFLRLEKKLSHIQKFKVNTEMMINGSLAKVISVNKKNGVSDFEFQIDVYEKCVVDNSVFLNRFGISEKVRERVIGLSNCPVVSGNSGSVVLDLNGEARGIVAWNMSPSIKSEGKENIKAWAGAISFSCIETQIESPNMVTLETCGILTSKE